MKRTFFFFIICFIAVATVCYILWLCGDSIYSLYKDRRLARELDELEEWARDKRAGAGGGEAPPNDKAGT